MILTKSYSQDTKCILTSFATLENMQAVDLVSSWWTSLRLDVFLFSIFYRETVGATTDKRNTNSDDDFARLEDIFQKCQKEKAIRLLLQISDYTVSDRSRPWPKAKVVLFYLPCWLFVT